MPEEQRIKIGSAKVRLEWLMTPFGLLIDSVELEGGPFEIDTDRLSQSSGGGSFLATVKAQSIQVFLENQAPAGMSNFGVEVHPDGVHVKATKAVIVQIPVNAHAKLKLDSPASLSIELISAAAMGAGLNTLVANQIEQLNPIITADQFPFPVGFESVEHTDGAVLLRGSLRIQE
jgi:hypothetical protein